MAQFHTEPKLLNFLCATPIIRQSPFCGLLPRNSFYKSVVEKQREQAVKQTHLLQRSQDLASVTLITEVNCCPTCTKYSAYLFRAKFPRMPLQVIELAKKVSEKIPAQFKEAKITIK
ncbi:MAG: hypothetical protein ACREJU_20680 [Nitrospiraceae bacterium]